MHIGIIALDSSFFPREDKVIIKIQKKKEDIRT